MIEPDRVPDLYHLWVRTLREPSSTRPHIFTIMEKGKEAVVKDFTANGFFFRNIIGRFLVWREKKAYRRLKGLKGTPDLYRVVKGLTLVLELIPGTSLEEIRKTEDLPRGFFDDLKALVEAFHDRGVCHCDLKRAANILVGLDGRPVVIDWSAAILEREFRCFPLTLIYRRFMVDDLNAVTKFQLLYFPDTVSIQQTQRYASRSRAEQAVRALRDRLRALLKRLA